MTTDTSRAFVLGFDGMPWNLVERWARDGGLPNFRRLIEDGSAGPLTSTMPPTTALAWPTIATGTRPDKHGVYSFHRINDDYTHEMSTRNDVSRPELWDLVSPAVVGNVPMTYPADDIDGTMVAGMMSPGMGHGFTHPPEFADEVTDIPGYRIGLSWDEYRDRPGAFRRELSSLVSARRALLNRLMDEDWRLFFFVFVAPDRLQHLFWEEDVLLDLYRDLDDVLGEAMTYANDRDANLFVVSDHGFGPVSKTVYLNTLLRREGYLTMKGGGGTRGWLDRFGVTKDRIDRGLRTLGVDKSDLVARLPGSVVTSIAENVPGDHYLYDVDFAETVAFVDGVGELYVNDEKRFDRGVVAPADVPAVKAEVAAAFEEVTDPETGEAILTVHDGDGLFPTDDRSPDLVIRGIDGYLVGRALTDDVLGDDPKMVANHRRQGIFLAWGPDVRGGGSPDDATVADVAPTVLHSVGEPVPADADGRVLREVFAPGSLPARTDVSERAYADDGSTAAVDEDFTDVEDRLQGLGYME